MNEQIPHPEQFPEVTSYNDPALEYEPLTWQHPEVIQAGDVVKMTLRDGSLLIFACQNQIVTAVHAEGTLTVMTRTGEVQDDYALAWLTLAHPAPALREAGVQFVELEIAKEDKRTRYQPLVEQVEKTHVPQLEAAVRYEWWQRAATEALNTQQAQAILQRAQQHLQEKAMIEATAHRYTIAAEVLQELQNPEV